jgi:hypothetical protein
MALWCNEWCCEQNQCTNDATLNVCSGWFHVATPKGMDPTGLRHGRLRILKIVARFRRCSPGSRQSPRPIEPLDEMGVKSRTHRPIGLLAVKSKADVVPKTSRSLESTSSSELIGDIERLVFQRHWLDVSPPQQLAKPVGKSILSIALWNRHSWP